jgi:hypothetical protein
MTSSDTSDAFPRQMPQISQNLYKLNEGARRLTSRIFIVTNLFSVFLLLEIWWEGCP